MTEAQDQDNDFFIDDIVDNAIVSNADAQFSFATDKLSIWSSEQHRYCG